MKIEVNKKIKDYLDVCMENVELNQVNSLIQSGFEGAILTDELEAKIKDLYNMFGRKNNRIMHSAKMLLDDPYYSKINLADIDSGRFKYENFTLQKGSYAALDELKPLNADMEEYIEMGYLSQTVNIPLLREDDEVWMSITPAEINSQKQAIKDARGDVLTFGLGMGYYQYMIAMKKSVKSITIIERDLDVINLFKENILPQFGDLADKISIIHGDLFDYWNEEYLSSYRYIYVDVWKGPVDGIEIVTKMYKQYNPGNSLNIGIWLEYTMYKFYRVAMLLYFRVLSGDIKAILRTARSEDLKASYNQVEKYFNSIDKVVKTQKELKVYLNDIQVYRDILAFG